MNKKKPRSAPEAVSFAQARDELFSHILRCGVIDALPEHQKDWFDDTMGYIADRYEDLSEEELASCACWASATASRFAGSRRSSPARPEPPDEKTKRPGQLLRGVFTSAAIAAEAAASDTPAASLTPPPTPTSDDPARAGAPGRSSSPSVEHQVPRSTGPPTTASPPGEIDAGARPSVGTEQKVRQHLAPPRRVAVRDARPRQGARPGSGAEVRSPAIHPTTASAGSEAVTIAWTPSSPPCWACQSAVARVSGHRPAASPG